jgi:hypothetical protein
MSQARFVPSAKAIGPIDGGPQTDVDAVLELQRSAGNRAVVQLLAIGQASPPPPVQRKGWPTDDADDDEPAPKVDPGVLVLKPDDNGKSPGDMTWNELQAAIDENEAFLKAHPGSSFENTRHEQRLLALHTAQDKLGAAAASGGQAKGAPTKGAKPARGKKAPPAQMPPKPRTLTEGSVAWDKEPPGAVKREMDLVVAYLAAKPPKAERQILMEELPNIEKAAGEVRAEHLSEKRADQFKEAFSPSGGDDSDRFKEILRRIQDAEPDPLNQGMWHIKYEGRVLPLSTEELGQVRDRIAKTLREAASKIWGLEIDVEDAWRERTEHNRSHSRTHRLVKFATGADDIPRSDMDHMMSNGLSFINRIKARAAANQFVAAGDDLQIFDNNARYYAEKVGKWESELMKGAGRWVLGLTVLKEALSIMAGFGAARLASVAGAGSTIGTLKAGFQIAGMTTATGYVSGALGAEAAGGDWQAGGRAGGGAGLGVGASAIGAGVTKFASIGDATKAATVAGKVAGVTKVVAIHTGVNVGLGVTQAALEGGDKKKAAIAALVTTPVTTLGGGVVDAVANSKVANAAGHVIVGTGGGVLGAAATDSSLLGGGLKGGGGALYGQVAGALDARAANGKTGEVEPANRVITPPDEQGGGGQPGGPRPGDTQIGLGFDGRRPAATISDAGDTQMGLGFDGRRPATGSGSGEPDPGGTKIGLGFDGRRPASGPGSVDPMADTIPGVPVVGPAAKPTIASPDALADTVPGVRTGDTDLGVGGTPRVPGPGAGRSGGTGADLSVPPDPQKLIGGPAKAPKYATLPEYAGRKPVMGQIVHIVDGHDEAAALYRRVYGEGQRKVLGTEFAELEEDKWKDYGGKGDPPLAWVRADGVIRFNLSKFTPPSLGGHTDQPLGPIRMPAGREEQAGSTGGASGPGGSVGPGKPAIFPGSKTPLEPGMQPARPATDEEVAAAVAKNPGSVHKSKSGDWHQQVYEADHGEGSAPTAYWSGNTIIVEPDYPLPSKGGGGSGSGAGPFEPGDAGLVGDRNDPTMTAKQVPESVYAAKERPMSAKELQDITTAVARVRAGVANQLASLRIKGNSGEDATVFQRVMGELRAQPERGTNQIVLDHADVAWKAMHNPELIAEVVSTVYGESLRDTKAGGIGAINRAVLRESAKVGPVIAVPKGSEIDIPEFFDNWVKTGRRFYDMGVDTEQHGQVTHLIQDLVVDLAFKRAGLSMTASEFKKTLGGAQARDIADPGNQLWIRIFDGADSLGRPEIMMPALRLVPGLDKLR